METLQTKRPVLPRDKRFLALHRKERSAVLSLCKETELQKIVLGDEKAGAGSRKVLDAAYWIKGCSSLGRLRCAVLVRDGKHGSIALLDIKEAAPATAPSASGARMPRDYAQRVVTGAKALSPNLGERAV